ncbi:MAG TPA: class I SAM-dependent methyltransferase [Verrucomicrobiae bacterium]|jgi:predicted O-methyltransferase YrrM|nr:class I SAM-dependent methyltransferase [Verrucomicrobiae bacterium]
MTQSSFTIPPHPKSSLKESVMRFLWHASGRRPSLDGFFTALLKHRHYLPEVDPAACIPRFDESEVKFRRCPVGAWSTPIIDVYVLIKAAIGFNSKRILELGSYRGDTARLIAENTPDDVRICTVDAHPDHGASYRDTPYAKRIDRKIGQISPQLFAPGEKYDFIFVDANHDYHSVMNDTMVALQVLSDQGVIFWHDYHFKAYFHGMGGVNEAMKYFSAQQPIVAINGTVLTMSSRHPGWETDRILRALPGKTGAANVWQDTGFRG